MENVVLVIHLILALGLIGVVLLQRSEGGGLGVGGGGAASAGRPAATALGKVTWGLAVAFIATSIALTIIAADRSSDVSVTDTGDLLPPTDGPTLPNTGEGLLPPAPDAGGVVVPEVD